jgi:hypothetical protein
VAQSFGTPPTHLPRWLLLRVLAYQFQVPALGGPDKATLRVIRQPKGRTLGSAGSGPFEARIASTREGADLRAGSLLVVSGRASWKGSWKRLRLDWQVLFQSFADRQGDDRHSLERPPLLWLANGDIRPRCASAPPDGERGDARPDVASDGPTASYQVGHRSSLPSDAVASAAGSAATLDRGRRRNGGATAAS